MNALEYLPPDGQAVTFGDAPPYELETQLDGLLSARSATRRRRAPGQVGETVTTVDVETRSIVATVAVRGTDAVDVWEAREQLAAALWTPPNRFGRRPETGVLRLHRDSMPTVEARAVPVDSPRDEDWRGPQWCEVTVEFDVPDPRWRDLTDRIALLEEGQGLVGPVSSPLVSYLGTTSATITNPGTVPSPIVARIYGPRTAPRIVLVDTDETIEVTGEIASDEILVIDTGFARKSVTIVKADGTEENALHRLNLDRADFFELAPGDNTLRIESDAGEGPARIAWRPRRAGV